MKHVVQGRVSRVSCLVVICLAYLIAWPLLSIVHTCAVILGMPAAGDFDLFPASATTRIIQPLLVSDTATASVFGAALVLGAVAFIALLAAYAGRLHDINLSGWYALTPLLSMHLLPPGAQTWPAAVAVHLVWGAVMICVPATDRAYRFGPIVSQPSRLETAQVF